MADVKISQLPAATTPLDGTEVLPIVQSATTKQVSIANVTAGRAMSASSLTLTTPLAVTSGGTGLATAAQGSLLSATGADTFSATRTPTLGLAGTAAGTLGLSGLTSGVVTLATAAAAGTWTFTLPTSGGTNGYILTTNGSGVSSWTNPTALGIDLDVGTTAITGGTSGRILYDNAGVLGEYSSVPVSKGGTGLTSLTAGYIPYGNGTGAFSSSSGLYFDGTNLGVGTSTIVQKLTVNGSVYVPDGYAYTFGSSASYISGNSASNFINFATSSSEKMRLDASGNLGLGVTPSAWSGMGAIQINPGGAFTTSSSYARFGSNFYYNGSYRYINASSMEAAQYEQAAGAHVFYTAGAGTAGNTISFTQAMTLDASGNLLVGNTTSVQSSRAEITSNSLAPALLARVNVASDEAQYAFQIQKTTATNTTSQIFARFLINNGATPSGYITANGANAATFTSTSDRRLKKNIVDLPRQLSNILSLRPVEFDFADDSGHQISFIAQEMKEIYPDAVGEREDGMLTIAGWGKTEARLVSAIQELAAKVSALEAKVNQ